MIADPAIGPPAAARRKTRARERRRHVHDERRAPRAAAMRAAAMRDVNGRLIASRAALAER